MTRTPDAAVSPPAPDAAARRRRVIVGAEAESLSEESRRRIKAFFAQWRGAESTHDEPAWVGHRLAEPWADRGSPRFLGLSSEERSAAAGEIAGRMPDLAAAMAGPPG